MKPGDKVIWFNIRRGHATTKHEAEVLKVMKVLVSIRLSDGRLTRVDKENLEVVR